MFQCKEIFSFLQTVVKIDPITDQADVERQVKRPRHLK